MKEVLRVLLVSGFVTCATHATCDLRVQPGQVTQIYRNVRVVDEHDAPVVNAEVAFCADFATEGAPDPRVDCELLFVGLPRYLTGPGGLVRLPTGLAQAAVIARVGERFGAAQLKLDDRVVAVPTLRIAPDRHVKVLVRGPDGEPRSGVPIEIEDTIGQLPYWKPRKRTELVGTDDTGHLTIWHAQSLCVLDPARPYLKLRARVVGYEADRVEVDLRQIRADPVELLCPAFGNLVVRRWLANGIPDGSSTNVRVWTIPLGEEDDAERAFGSTIDDMPGQWRSRPVTIGRKFRVYTEDSDVIDVEGPTRDRKEIRVDFFEPPLYSHENPRVSATVSLELPDGTPCANEIVLLGSPGSSLSSSVRTDARGRASFTQRRPIGWFHFHVPCRNLVASAPWVPEGNPSRVGIFDLGKLRLRVPRLVVSGQFIDATTKAPVCGALDIRGGALKFDWRTEPDGTFVVWDDPQATNIDADALTLVASSRSTLYGKATCMVAFGTSGVVVELHRERLLRCTLLVDSEIEEWPLDLRVQDGKGWCQWLSPASLGRGRLEWYATIPEGDPASWSLTIAGGDEFPPLYTGRGSGFRGNPDGYEVEVDLRDKLAEFNLFCPQLADSWGTSVTLLVRASGTSDPWRAARMDKYTTLVGFAGSRLDALVAPYNAPTVRLLLLPGLTEVALSRPLEIEIEVQGLSIKKGGLRAQLVLLDASEPWIKEAQRDGVEDPHAHRTYEWPRDADRIKAWVEAAPLSRRGVELESGRQRFELPRRGRYVVLPFVRQGRRLKFLDDVAVVCTADKPGEVVEVTLRIDPEKLRALMTGN